MPDYGHPLRFATFISPTNSPAPRPVELAQLSERLGFDLVTFQDHPYRSDFLDTWTPLSWVAARTERIGVSGNVLNLPLRQPPAVLAARDPREITRLLNIFPGKTPEALTQMALEDGVSIFIPMSDDPGILERFAAEVIPAVREQVARERKQTGMPAAADGALTPLIPGEERP